MDEETNGKTRTMPVPVGKEYGAFNGTLRLFSKEEVASIYGMPPEEMTQGYMNGVGLFEIPPSWRPEEGKEYGTAKWHEEHRSHATYYYYGR